MTEAWLARLGFAAMAVLAVATALYSFRFAGVLWGVWLGVDTGIRSVIERGPVEALTHMIVAPVALALGPWQFLPRLRARHLRLHRRAGRIYVCACVIAGLGGLVTSFHAAGGPVAGTGFGLLAVLWMGTTLGAWRAAVARDIGLHRLLMRLSYAMTFAAVTLRLQIPVGFALGFKSYASMSVWLAYTAWIPNLIAVGIYSLIRASRHRKSPATA